MPIPTILSFGPSIRAQCLRFPLPLQVQKPETGDLSQSEQHNSCSSPSHPIRSDTIRSEKSRAETCTLDILACLFYSAVLFLLSVAVCCLFYYYYYYLSLADFGNYLPSDSIVYGLGQQVIYLAVHSATAQFALELPVHFGSF